MANQEMKDILKKTDTVKSALDKYRSFPECGVIAAFGKKNDDLQIKGCNL